MYVDWTLRRVLDLNLSPQPVNQTLTWWVITRCSFNWIGDILYLGWRRWPEFVLQWKAVRCQGEEPGFGLCDHFVFEVGRVTVVLFVQCVLSFNVLPQHVLSQGYAFYVFTTVRNGILNFHVLWIILADSAGWEYCLDNLLRFAYYVFRFNLFNILIQERWQNYYIFCLGRWSILEWKPPLSLQLSCFYSRVQVSRRDSRTLEESSLDSWLHSCTF